MFLGSRAPGCRVLQGREGLFKIRSGSLADGGFVKKKAHVDWTVTTSAIRAEPKFANGSTAGQPPAKERAELTNSESYLPGLNAACRPPV